MTAGRHTRAAGRARTRAGNLAGILTLILAMAAPLLAGGTPAAADPAAAATAPFGTGATTLQFTVSDVSPSVITSGSGNALSIRGAVSNTGKTAITNLIYRLQRGKPLTNSAAVHKEIAEPSQPTAVISGDWTALAPQIAAGADAQFAIATAIAGPTIGSLRITKPGVYPLMVNVNGTTQIDGQPHDVRVGELHLLVTVMSVPGATGTRTAARAAVPFTMLWPLISRPHRGVGGVFLNDSLATDLAAGGVLADRLDALASAHLPPGTATLAIDPLLLDEIEAMSRGYRVQAPHTVQGPITQVPTSPARTHPPETAAETAAPTTQAPTSTAAPINTAAPTDTAPTAAFPHASTVTPSDTASTDAARTTEPAEAAGAGSAAERRTVAPHGSSSPAKPAGPVRSAAAPSADGTPSADAAPSADATPAGSESATTESAGAPATAPGSTAPATAPSNTAPATAPSSTAPSSSEQHPPNTVAGTGAAVATAFLARLREQAAIHPVLVLPFSDPDAVALTRAGGSIEQQAALGRTIAARVLGGSQRITDIALPPDALTDPQTLDSYLAAGYHSVLVSGNNITGSARPGVALTDTAAGHTVTTLIDDSDLRNPIGNLLAPADGGTGALALNSAVALLARHAFDGDAHPVLRMPDTVVAAAGLADLGSALTALTADGAVHGADLADLAHQAQTAPKPPHVTLALPTAQQRALLPDDYVRSLLDQRRQLDLLGKALPASLAPGAAALIGELRDALRPLASATLRADLSPGDAVLGTVNGTVEHLHAGVTIRPTRGSYTLASTDSPLVLTVQNTLPFTVKVKIQIDGGNQVGLTTQPQDWLTLTGGSTRQLQIPATVSRAGAFIVSAQLIGPDGQNWNDPVPLKIRSNAYGTLTIVLIAVAGGVLLLMVVLRIWQRWRARQRRIADQATRAQQPAPPPEPGSIIASAGDPEDGDPQ